MSDNNMNEGYCNRSIPNPISGNEKSVIQGLYDEMCWLEYHYDKLQNATKEFSMTWLAAGFLGIAYIVENFSITSIFSESLELFFIFNLVAFGFYIQWFSDVGIYHRQLKAVFLSQQEYEIKYPYLNKTHQKMSSALENKKKGVDPVRYHAQFYFRIILALVSLSILTLLPDILNKNFWNNLVIKFTAYIIVIIHIFFIAILFITTKKSGAIYKE